MKTGQWPLCPVVMDQTTGQYVVALNDGVRWHFLFNINIIFNYSASTSKTMQTHKHNC